MDKKELKSLSGITDVTLLAVDNIDNLVREAFKMQNSKNPFANIERVDFIDAASNNTIRLLDELKNLLVEYRMSHGYTVYAE